MGVSKTSDHIQMKIKMPNPSQDLTASSKVPNQDMKNIDVLCTFKFKIESQILDHGSIAHIQSRIKITNPSQEPPVSLKAKIQTLTYIDVLCTFEIIN